jgi:hypothetical protein
MTRVRARTADPHEIMIDPEIMKAVRIQESGWMADINKINFGGCLE